MAGFVAAAGVGSRLLLLSSVSGYAIAHTLAGAPEDTTGSAVGSNSTAPTPTGSGLRVGSSAPGQPVLASACAVPTKQAPHAEDRPSAPGPGPAASRSGEEAARSSGSTSSPTPPSGPPAVPPSPSPPPSAAQPESPKHHPARGKPAPAPSADAPALSSVEPETDDLTTADAAAPSAEAAPPVSEPTSSPAPASGTGSNAVLVVSRPDGALSVLPRLDDSEKWEPCGHIHGILGLFDCSSGTHLVVVKQCASVAFIDGELVYRVSEVGILPLASADGQPPASSIKSETGTSTRPDSRLMQVGCGNLVTTQEIHRLFASGGFYFSSSGRILHSSRSYFHKSRPEPTFRTLADGRHIRWDGREDYIWNMNMLLPFLRAELHEWVLPILQGYVETAALELHGNAFELVIISRRLRHRAGTRYKRRGIDRDGHTANFVETEQRVVFGPTITSFVALRGSIPVFWTQDPSYLEYKPGVTVQKTPVENEEAYRKHLLGLLAAFGPIYMINLISQRGREWVVGEMFELVMRKAALPSVKYLAFDFHEECKGLKFENVYRLVDSIEGDTSKIGYTWIDEQAGIIVKEQNGAYRVNCLDSLDRTNLVQSAINKGVVWTQLEQLGIIGHTDTHPKPLVKVLQHMWANNGDAISRQYAGTDAMKGDYTRTGRRNLKGVFADHRKSVARFYHNNFRDSYRQTAIDVLQAQDDFDGADQTEDGGGGIVTVKHPNSSLHDLVATFRKALIPATESVLGSWPVFRIDSQVKSEAVIYITAQSFYIVYCDFDTQSIISHTKTSLASVLQVEAGRLDPRDVAIVGMSPARIKQMMSPVKSSSYTPALRFYIQVASPDPLMQAVSAKVPIWYSDLLAQLSTKARREYEDVYGSDPDLGDEEAENEEREIDAALARCSSVLGLDEDDDAEADERSIPGDGGSTTNEPLAMFEDAGPIGGADAANVSRPTSPEDDEADNTGTPGCSDDEQQMAGREDGVLAEASARTAVDGGAAGADEAEVREEEEEEGEEEEEETCSEEDMEDSFVKLRMPKATAAMPDLGIAFASSKAKTRWESLPPLSAQRNSSILSEDDSSDSDFSDLEVSIALEPADLAAAAAAAATGADTDEGSGAVIHAPSQPLNATTSTPQPSDNTGRSSRRSTGSSSRRSTGSWRRASQSSQGRSSWQTASHGSTGDGNSEPSGGADTAPTNKIPDIGMSEADGLDAQNRDVVWCTLRPVHGELQRDPDASSEAAIKEMCDVLERLNAGRRYRFHIVYSNMISRVRHPSRRKY